MANSTAAVRAVNDRNRELWTLEMFNYCHFLRLDWGFTARLKLIIVDKQVGKIAASVKYLLWLLQSLCYGQSYISFNYGLE